MTEQTPYTVQWRTSSYSGGSGTECVQVGLVEPRRTIATRDSKDPSGPVLAFTPGEWQTFLADVKRGVYDA
ncbi:MULTISPECIES: DUF397 domain-containing protein [Actinomadura]|jgi:hypothetical protein|uniref:DUF397 domain-containing protein n=1 Tax=Actinomadura montaniterrae TaxID=1803903 RepID=A0A6L3VJY2_9ACTN|nr:DUF397 domain-containing protein [Actinomadura montaniterrae]KAB2371385.1 DUF397 domain-containing protein [Actinomadura montaniterrae]